MGIKLGKGPEQIEILQWHEKHAAGSSLEFSDRQQAFRLLQRYAGDAAAMRLLRNMLADLPGGSSLHRLRDARVLERVSRELAAGRLKIAAAAPLEWSARGGAVAPPEPDEQKKAPPPPAPKGGFIVFKVVDNDTGKPLAGVKLKIKLTNGQVAEFTTDWSGMVDIRGIPSGSCDIQSMSCEDVLEVVEVG